MNAPLSTMLARDAVSRREDALAAASLLAEEGRLPRRHVRPVPALRRWIGRALAAGGGVLVQTGARVAGDRAAPTSARV